MKDLFKTTVKLPVAWQEGLSNRIVGRYANISEYIRDLVRKDLKIV